MKIKHYAVFNNESEKLNWERLRNDATESSYFLPYTKEEYLKKVDTAAPSDMTAIIIREIKKTGCDHLFSLGSGVAAQEYQIKKFSDLRVVVSDYNPSVLRLKSFGVFDDAVMLDAFKDKIPVDKDCIMLFPRIDTEFDDEALRSLFEKCAGLGIKHICFIPAQLLDFSVVVSEIKVMLLSVLKRKKRVFCGYSRTKAAFNKIWGDFYRISGEFNPGKEFFFLQAIK
ncbi:hypothetical protein ACFOTA_13680 [Chitinophaga sp. GCM10012297]|uniref:Uncharacterized protein n=1 Tax=Chitinophaga chungangae TaxID=2821488 RepID=A0ABS3YF16_9BACT|nr:hypothetical protein [Chitinophaga chungangae]MBO9153266.1 hypothetical protein [Chitinophaga chungangae]